MKKIFFLIFLGSVSAIAQVNSNQPVVNAIAGQNPFLDASTNFNDPGSVGKGLVFPQADLTTWTFDTSALDGINFPTAFDGMIVYNTGSGTTLENQGQIVSVTPGFYYFSNPGATDNITNGQWIKFEAGAAGGKFVDGINPADAVFTTGNVGIGTDNPLGLLSMVRHQNNYTSVGLANWHTGASARALMAVTSNEGGGKMLVFSHNSDNFNGGVGFETLAPNTGVIYTGGQSNGLNIVNGGTGDINFATGGYSNFAKKMIIKQNGNVGIGTTTPENILSVRKDQNTATISRITNIDSGVLSRAIVMATSNESGSKAIGIAHNSENYNFGVGFETLAPNTGVLYTGGQSNGLTIVNGGTGDINFATGGYSNFAKKMIIKQNGDVGIGTGISPSSKLDVDGYIKLGSADTRGDASPQEGMLRFNTVTKKFQGYDGTSWVDLN